MKNVIGSREQFGIEFALLYGDQAAGVWMYGRCCYWVSGVMVGEYNLGTSLRDVLAAYPYIVGDNGKRDGGRLCGLGTREIFETLEGILYRGDIVPGDERYLETAARFSLKPAVDVFDGCRIYCVACERTARVIYSSPSHPEPVEARFALQAVEDAIQQFYEELNEHYETALRAKTPARA